MASDERAQRVLAEIARRTGTDARDWHLVFRARHAMAVVLRALRETRGYGEVATQLLTCCTAVDPIYAAGLAVRYADVSPDTLALDAEQLPLGADTRAVVLQHTFGLFDQKADAALVARAHSVGALVLEDCAHCACHLSRDASGAPLADVSVHSFGIQKMAPAGFGAAVWVNPSMEDAGLRDAIVAALQSLPAADDRLERAVKGYDLQIRVLLHLPMAIRRPLRNLLVRRRAFIPAVADEERRGIVSYDATLPGGSTLACMREGLDGLDAREGECLEATRIYAKAFAPLAQRGLVSIPKAALGQPRPLMRFPLVLDSQQRADALVEAIEAQGCYCDSWGRPALYPGALDWTAYGLSADGELSRWPHTQGVVQGIVPLYNAVPADEAHLVAQIVTSFLEEG